jgi:hypothetical protein
VGQFVIVEGDAFGILSEIEGCLGAPAFAVALHIVVNLTLGPRLPAMIVMTPFHRRSACGHLPWTPVGSQCER